MIDLNAGFNNSHPFETGENLEQYDGRLHTHCPECHAEYPTFWIDLRPETSYEMCLPSGAYTVVVPQIATFVCRSCDLRKSYRPVVDVGKEWERQLRVTPYGELPVAAHWMKRTLERIDRKSSD